MQDPLEFPAHELTKCFKEGDHVKVIKGKYEGDTGLIVRVEEDYIILFSDLTFHEVFIGVIFPESTISLYNLESFTQFSAILKEYFPNTKSHS